jgi:carboxyl-terminal processing protease
MTRISMKIRLLLALPLALGLTFSQLQAKPQPVAIDDLRPTQQQQKTVIITRRVMEKYHYKKHRLNDTLSAEILRQYLKLLDPNKSFFIADDIRQLRQDHRKTLDDDIRNARLESAFDIFKLYRVRVEQRATHALGLLEQPVDITSGESYRVDREDAEWSASSSALDDLWRKRIVNDYIGLKLTDKDDEEIREQLTRRYQSLLNRTQQMTSNDVFQTFMNAYSLALEPHTGYMLPHNAENFDISMRLSLQGIGAVLSTDNEHTVIQKIVPGGPADKSGKLKAGDKVIGVAQGRNGEMVDVVGWRLQKVVEKIRGRKGSIVRLNVIPKKAGNSGAAKEILIVRDKIKLEEQAAKHKILEEDPALHGMRIAVIEIPAFYRDFRSASLGKNDFRSTTRDVRDILLKLQDENIDGVVIDLRNNGGGSLTEATELTGLFIEEGPVVQIKDYNGSIESEVDPDPQMVYTGPLAVMINRNSASASEIFAGAIQDYGRGVLIGEPTFGKGTVQQLIDLDNYISSGSDMGRLRLTIAQFFRVKGGSTQHKGVVPDILFPTIEDEDYGERAYDNALPWAKIPAASFQGWGLGNLEPIIAAHRKRVRGDSGFAYLQGEARLFEKLKNEESVSLNFNTRQNDWNRQDAERRKLRNEYRRSLGLSPLSKADEENEELTEQHKEEEKVDEIESREAARILADIIRQKSNPVIRAAQNTSVTESKSYIEKLLNF